MEHEGPDGDFSGVSLVELGFPGEDVRRVEFFQWTEPPSAGRIATLDQANRIKAIVPVGSRRLPLQLNDLSAFIIWRDTGVKHVKAQWKKDQQQSQMPQYLLRLKDMWTTANDPSFNSLAFADHHPVCFLCGLENTNQFPVQPAKPCCLCLMASHVACVREILPSLRAEAMADVATSGNTLQPAHGDRVGDEACLATPRPVLQGFNLPRNFMECDRPGASCLSCAQPFFPP